MKIIYITPLVLLATFLFSTIVKGFGIEYLEKSMCLNLQQKEVRLNQLKSFTKQTIPKEAILFVKRNNKEFCADPSMPWVIKAVAALDKRAKNNQPENKKATNNKKTVAKNKRGKNKQNKKNAPKVQSSMANPTATSPVAKP